MFEQQQLLANLSRIMASLLTMTIALGPSVTPAFASSAKPVTTHSDTATPIQHLVVIFQENVSFDHYFGTYPNALNPKGEPKFKAASNTPTVNGLAGNLPAVSFLKAQAYQDGHAGYSDPLDEQTFLVNTINFLETLPTWSSTAVVIMYDDSDGWYDHQIGPIVNTSTGPADALTGPNACGTAATALPGLNPANTHALGRCGYGPRLPLLVVSPWARRNFVDHSVTDQTSITRFVEDNWLGGQRIGQGSYDALANSITQLFNFRNLRNSRRLFLNPSTGEKE